MLAGVCSWEVLCDQLAANLLLVGNLYCALLLHALIATSCWNMSMSVSDSWPEGTKVERPTLYCKCKGCKPDPVARACRGQGPRSAVNQHLGVGVAWANPTQAPSRASPIEDMFRIVAEIRAM